MSDRDNAMRQHQTVQIAHLSDLHLSPLPFPPTSHLNVKTFLGYLNWHMRRKMFHDNAIVDRLVTDMKTFDPDHVMVSGDLVNMALPTEFAQATRWLESLGTAETVSVVPGNHDIYASWRDAKGVGKWAAYMRQSFDVDVAGSADEASLERGTGRTGRTGQTGRHGLPPFPFVRRIGDVALIGVNSSVPTMPLNASGSICETELRRLETVLSQCARLGLFRLVMLHHPPLLGLDSVGRGLRQAQALQCVFARAGVDLVVHGHTHIDSLAWGETLAGVRYPVVGIASASCNESHGAQPIGRYNVYTIKRVSGSGQDTRPAAFTIDVLGRGPKLHDGPVITRDHYRFADGERRDVSEVDAETHMETT